MKGWMVHYLNKLPGSRVNVSDSGLDVYLADGEYYICVRKDGAGQMKDMSEEYGLRGRHDLAPIPKDARVHKVIDGKIGLAEEHEERKKMRPKFLCGKGEKVLSCKELEAKGFKFDDKQQLVKEPAAQEQK